MEENKSQNAQNSTPPETVSPPPQAAAPPRKPMSLFKKIIYSVVGVVCFFGLIQVALQSFFPEKKSNSQPIAITPANVSWKTYTNKKNNYSVTYPDYLKFSENKYSTVFVTKVSKADSEEFPSLYISVIPEGTENTTEIYNYMSPDSVSKFFTMMDNESLETQSWPYAEYSTFKKLAALPVAGIQGVVIQNNNVLKGEGIVNRRILVKNGNYTYIIGSYYKTQQDLDVLRIFLESFKFLK